MKNILHMIQLGALMTLALFMLGFLLLQTAFHGLDQ